MVFALDSAGPNIARGEEHNTDVLAVPMAKGTARTRKQHHVQYGAVLVHVDAHQDTVHLGHVAEGRLPLGVHVVDVLDPADFLWTAEKQTDALGRGSRGAPAG